MTAKAFFAWHGNTCVLKLKGTIRFADCPSIDKFIKATLERTDDSRMLVDLAETVLVDSTALGMIAQIAIEARDNGSDKPTMIINNKDLLTLFKSVCFDRVFNIVQPNDGENGSDFNSLDSEQSSDESTLASQVQDAHQNLMQLSYDNRLSFKEVMDALDQQGETAQEPV